MSFNQSGPGGSTSVGTAIAIGCGQYNITTNSKCSVKPFVRGISIYTFDVVENATIVSSSGQIFGMESNESRMKGKLSSPSNAQKIDCSLELEKRLKPMTVPEQEANKPKCLDGTRVDLLQRIREWASSSDSPNIFLLTGIAGTGKSTIARTVAEEFKEKKKLGCYIFFERGKTNPSTITSTVIRTIAYYLARNSPVVAKSIWEIADDDRLSSFPSTNILFQNLLNVPLHSAIKNDVSNPILVVLDALDECGPPDAQNELASLLRDKISTLPPIFRFLVTSRPENGVRSLLRTPVSPLSPFCIQSELDHTSALSKEDALNFVAHKMKELRERGDWHVPKDWPWNEKIRVLGEAANGSFIWASIAIKYISGKRPCQFEDLKKLIDDIGSVNRNLSGLYATVLEGSLDWDDETKGRFSKIFSLILFGKRQLTVKEIDEFLEMPVGTTRSLLSYLQSLVTYEEGKMIRIHHTSLYDYLISPESVDLAWHIDEENQKNIIAHWCFKQMKKGLRFNICDLETSFVMNKDVVRLEERVRNNIPTSLKYACQNWALHLRDVPYSEQLSEYLHDFAYESLLYWVEVLSFTGSLYICLGPALEISVKWLDVS